MNQMIGHIALVVTDYDEAIEFYVDRLGFQLIEDTTLSEEKRWVVVGPKGNRGTTILLAKAANEHQSKAVGDQCGGRVFLFLLTDDFQRDFSRLNDQKIEIVRPPKDEPYGKVAVFKDLYGNMWDLLQPNSENSLYERFVSA